MNLTAYRTSDETQDALGDKNWSDDRQLILEVIEGKKPLNTLGIVDSRLFNGSNELHAIRDGTGLWYFKYSIGNIPPPLRQKFTSFSILKRFAEAYFGRRNIKIKEVINA